MPAVPTTSQQEWEVDPDDDMKTFLLSLDPLPRMSFVAIFAGTFTPVGAYTNGNAVLMEGNPLMVVVAETVPGNPVLVNWEWPTSSAAIPCELSWWGEPGATLMQRVPAVPV